MVLKDDLAIQIEKLSKSFKECKDNPSQEFIDRIMAKLAGKLSERDRILDLELRDLSKTVKMEIQHTVFETYKLFEEKINLKIRESINNQKEKVSWGVEMIRLITLVGTLLVGIKMMGK